MGDKATLIWSFEDAPQWYRDLSPEAADWVALVPKGKWQKVCEEPGNEEGLYFYQVPTWLESPSFSKEGVYFFEVSEGRLVVIGKV